MNHCYLPEFSSIRELKPLYGNEFKKVYFFHNKVKDHINILLGRTYVLPEVLAAFKDFSTALAPLINPTIDFEAGQVKEKDRTNKFDIYDRYFEVSRVKAMTHGQFIQQYLDTSAELVNEFQYTSMSRGEIAYILKGWEAANQILLANHQPSAPQFSDTKIVEVAPQNNDERALYRWKVAHHGFGIFMIFSGYCFDKAINAIINQEAEAIICDWLDKGAHLFRATTACMEFGNSFTATVYREVIRPDMSRANEEANLPNGFSGTQNYEYVVWRKLKVKLFNTIKAHKESLSAAVMEKAELFRTYYLEDMHIHSIIAGRMVGIEKSLLQEGFHSKKGKAMAITAGDMLRMMAQMRVKETDFIIGR
jgi:hypothetical protein